MSISPHSAANCRRSMLDWLSLNKLVNIRKAYGSVLYSQWSGSRCVPFPLHDCAINLAGNGSAIAAPGAAVFDHHHHGVTWLLVRRERHEPDVVRDGSVVSVFNLGRARFCANAHFRHARGAPRALGIFDVGEHCLMQTVHGALRDAQTIADAPRWKNYRLRGNRRVRRINTIHQPWIKNEAAIGDCR